MVGDTTSLIKVDGPFAIEGNRKPWDEKGRAILTQIFISHTGDEIRGLQFQYVENGKLVLSPAYGDLGKGNFTTISFGDVNEYITGLSGTFKYQIVTSLSFQTNRKIYGPYGGSSDGDSKGSSDGDSKFNFGLGPLNQFGGFHGSFSTYPRTRLANIGVYLKPTTNLNVFLPSSSSGGFKLEPTS